MKVKLIAKFLNKNENYAVISTTWFSAYTVLQKYATDNNLKLANYKFQNIDE